MKTIDINLKVIGIVHSPFKTTSDAPNQGNDTISEIEIDKELEEGLKHIEGFSHLHVFYWLHESKGYNLSVNTPWDDFYHGLFTTRSPHRPNPIGHAIVELVERKGKTLKVKFLDAIEGTPIIDIKPYVKNLDIKNNSSSGWIQKTKLNR